MTLLLARAGKEVVCEESVSGSSRHLPPVNSSSWKLDCRPRASLSVEKLAGRELAQRMLDPRAAHRLHWERGT